MKQLRGGLPPGSVLNRPPVMCAGCPHRGFFYELSKLKNVIITGDIGCYGLAGAEPLNAMDTCINMGASISMGHGAQKIFERSGSRRRVIATIGDSTFFHTGMNSLLQIAYNCSNTITCILDNRITAMTGHQQHPGTGLTLQGMPAKKADIATIVKALGIEHVRTVNPLQIDEVHRTLEWALRLNEASVIISRWPCVLKQRTDEEIAEFGVLADPCFVDPDQCTGCKVCLRTGCPALIYNAASKIVMIDQTNCVGCELCMQVCKKFGAIKKAARA